MAFRENQNKPRLGTNTLMFVPLSKSFQGCFRPGDEEDATAV
jgi:hypothetical protein